MRLWLLVVLLPSVVAGADLRTPAEPRLPASPAAPTAASAMDGVTRLSPAPDLPGAEPLAELSAVHLERALRPAPERPAVFPETGVVSAVLGAPSAEMGSVADAALRDGRLSPALYDLYSALRGVVDGPEPDGERAALALAMQDKFVSFLRAVRSPGREPGIRAPAGRVLHRTVLTGALVRGLFERRVVAAKTEALRAALAAAPVSPRVRERAKRSLEPADAGWKLPRRVAAESRVPDESIRLGRASSLSAIAERADSRRFMLERQARRAAITASDPRFSAAFRRKHRRRLESLFLKTAPYSSWYDDMATQLVGNRLLNQFIAPERRGAVAGPLHVPSNPNLALRFSREEGFVLQAALTTDIAEPAVAEYVKASIEDYWRGVVGTAAGPVPLRTAVTVRRLGPGERFADDDLRLTETGGLGAYATRLGIAFARRIPFWGTAAHEFGHVLGLPDDYRVDFDPRAVAFRESGDRASLMASDSTGAVRQEHLQLVAVLLEAGGRVFFEDR